MDHSPLGCLYKKPAIRTLRRKAGYRLYNLPEWQWCPSYCSLLSVESLFGRSGPTNHIKRTCSCADLKQSRERITHRGFAKHDIEASHERCSVDRQVETPVRKEQARQAEVNMHDLSLYINRYIFV